MLKKLLKTLCVSVMSLCLVLGLTACGDDAEVEGVNPEIYSIYELAVADGETKTYEEWLDSIRGVNGINGITPQIGPNGNWFLGTTDTGVSATGSQGADGKQVEFRKTETHIQWRYVGGSDSSWQNLIALTDIKGEQGNPGSQGAQGDPGADGKNVLFRVTETYIQYRYEGEDTWTNLVPLSELRGQQGQPGAAGQTPYIGTNGNWFIGETDLGVKAGIYSMYIEGGHLKIKYTENGEAVDLGEVQGATAREIELRSNGTYIQWRYKAEDQGEDDNWENIEELSELQGQAGKGISSIVINESGDLVVTYTDDEQVNLGQVVGAQGIQGVQGPQGEQGPAGQNGVTPHIDAATGNWFIGETDLGVKAGIYSMYIEGGHLKIKYTENGEAVDLGEVQGAAEVVEGTAREIELRSNGTYIQWRYKAEDQDEDDNWENIVALSELQGQDGQAGKGISSIVINESGHLVVTYTDNEQADLGQVVGAQGIQGNPGADGKNVLFRVTETYIQYRYDGEEIWTNLVPLSELRGPAGQTPEIGTNGNWFIGETDLGVKAGIYSMYIEGGHLKIKYTENGEAEDLGEVQGAAEVVEGTAREIELRSNGTYIQWRYVDEDQDEDDNWENIVALSELHGQDGQAGPAGKGISSIVINDSGDLVVTYTDNEQKNLGQVVGAQGIQGVQGPQGEQGPAGQNGVTPHIDETTGHWFVGDVDTGVSAQGPKGDKGDKGDDGVGIDRIDISNEGDLCIYYTDGSSDNLGVVLGEQGSESANVSIGEDGYLYIDGTKTILQVVDATDTCRVTFDKTYEIIFEDFIDKTIAKNTCLEGMPIPNESYEASFLGWFIEGTDTEVTLDTPITESVTLEARFSTKPSGLYQDGLYIKTWPALREKYAAIGEHSIGTGSLDGSSLANLSGILIVDNSITSIGSHAFDGCTRLKEIVLPNTITEIANSTFAGCTRLKKINIPTGVTSIRVYAFENCSSLQSLVIPSGVKTVESYTFEGCSSITTITFQGNITSIGSSSFRSCSKLNIAIPNTVKSIGDYAFEGCRNIKSITIPDAMTTIEKYAFAHTGITSITIPENVTKIKDGAFLGCGSATSVTFNYANGIEEIGAWAFAGCSMTNFSVPAGISQLAPNVFYGCAALKNVNFANSNNLTTIAANAFNGCTSLTGISIPNGVKAIGDSAFEGCTALGSISIPSKVQSLGEKAFSGCSKLATFTMEDDGDLGSIATKAFENCVLLTSLKIPAKVTSLGEYIISGCTKLTTVTFADNIILKNIGSDVFRGSYIKNITLPASLETIGSQAFYNCYSLQTVSFATGSVLKEIGTWAFENCSVLNSISIPDTIEHVGHAAFLNTNIPYTTYKNAYYLGNSTNNYLVLMSMTDQSLTSLSVHPDTKVVAGFAVRDCQKLRSVTFESNTNLITIGADAFANCRALEEISIPSSVKYIDRQAFHSCVELTSVDLPSTITSIDENAFKYDVKLTTVKISSSTVANGLVNASSMGYILENASLVYIEQSLSTTSSTYLQNNFTKKATSDIAGYNKWERNQ